MKFVFMQQLNKVLTLLGVFVWISLVQSQSIFEYSNFKHAVANGTRTRLGIPGPDYWINKSNYFLEAEIDTSNDQLSGKAKITYFNNSPDTLHTISLRWYQNVYEKGAVRDIRADKRNITDGTYISMLSVNGIQYIKDNQEINDSRVFSLGTIMNLILHKKIGPGDSVQIDVVWDFHIPIAGGDRAGSYGKNYFIGYWYPQIAVYDDMGYWDYWIQHTGSMEFYNDFNDFDVKIKAPAGYSICGTGKCINYPEIYRKDIFQRVTEAYNSEAPVKILKREDFGKKPVTTGKPWHFKVDHIPDFAFALTKDYLWEGQLVNIGSKKVFVDVLLPSDDFPYNISLAEAVKSVVWFSNEMPGIPYPYEHATVFFNGNYNEGSMEFPMIVNNSTYDSAEHGSIIAHELFHNYMPFLLGFNESSYSWMDEGWAFYVEQKYLGSNYSMPHNISYYKNFAGDMFDYPLMTTTATLWEEKVFGQVYFKPALNIYLLENLLGEELLLKSIHKFADDWKGKHPTPFDYFYSINQSVGENLFWFWNPCFFEFGYADLKIKNANFNSVTIEKVGNIPVPVRLEITFADGSNQTIDKNLRVWKDSSELSIPLSGKKIQEIKLGGPLIPDGNPDNNVFLF